MIIVNAWARQRGEQVTQTAMNKRLRWLLQYILCVINHVGIFWSGNPIPYGLLVFLSVRERYNDRNNRGRELAGNI
jgi:hypothetical protein